MKDKPIVIGLAALSVVLSVRGYLELQKLDHNAPTIVVPTSAITYTDGENYSELLKGVTAVDTEDGDVTDTLIVEKVSTDASMKKAVITYAAIDRKNNLAKIDRTVTYVPSDTIDEEASVTPLPTIKPEITPEPTQASADNSSSSSLNTMSPMVVGTSPILYIKSNKITIKQNEKFTINDFVAGVIDDKDTGDIVLKMEGAYNLKAKGTYKMILYAVDTEGNESNREKVTLIVR